MKEEKTRQEKKYFDLRRITSLNRMTTNQKFNEGLYEQINRLEVEFPELREAYNLS